MLYHFTMPLVLKFSTTKHYMLFFPLYIITSFFFSFPTLQSRRVEYIPVATLGAIGIAGLLYILQGLCLTNMVSAETLMDCTTKNGVFVADLFNTTSGCRDPMTKVCDATKPPSIPGYSVSFVYAFSLRGM